MASIASMRGEPGIVSIPGPGPVLSRRRGRRRTRAALAGCALLGAAAVLLRPGGEGNDARPGNRTARGLEAQRKPWVPVPSPPAERTSMPPVPSPPPAPVAGVRTALFFVPVEPNLRANNKMNSQHSLEHYSSGIERTCRFLADELGGYPTEVAGDVEFVREANGGGKCGGEGGGEHPMGLGELAHAEAAAAVQRHLCKRKMATDKHDARRILDGHVRVYLSRLEVLCDLAQRNPLELTVLVDADLDPALWDAVRDMIDSRLADPSDSSLSAFSHADHNDPGGAGGIADDDIDDDDGNAAPPPAPPASRRAWFGRPSCRVPPLVATDFLAIRGRDCPAWLAPYRDEIRYRTELSLPVPLLPDAGPCPCWDDETVLTDVARDRLGPGRLTLHGLPRPVPSDDDDALIVLRSEIGRAYVHDAGAADEGEEGGSGYFWR